MEKENIYEDKNLRLEYVKAGAYIHETWWGSTPPEIFKGLLDTIISELNIHRASGIILDAREHKGLGPNSQALAAEKMGEYARKIGYFRQAIIIPKDVFSKFSVENFSKKLENDASDVVITKYFDNLEDAESWLNAS